MLEAGAIKLEWLVWRAVLGRALSRWATTLTCMWRDSSVHLFNRHCLTDHSMGRWVPHSSAGHTSFLTEAIGWCF